MKEQSPRELNLSSADKLIEEFPFLEERLHNPEIIYTKVLDNKRLLGPEDKLQLLGGSERLKELIEASGERDKLIPLILLTCKQGAMIPIEIEEIAEQIGVKTDSIKIGMKAMEMVPKDTLPPFFNTKIDIGNLHLEIPRAIRVKVEDNLEGGYLKTVEGITFIHRVTWNPSAPFRVTRDRIGYETTLDGGRKLEAGFTQKKSGTIFDRFLPKPQGT